MWDKHPSSSQIKPEKRGDKSGDVAVANKTSGETSWGTSKESGDKAASAADIKKPTRQADKCGDRAKETATDI